MLHHLKELLLKCQYYTAALWPFVSYSKVNLDTKKLYHLKFVANFSTRNFRGSKSSERNNFSSFSELSWYLRGKCTESSAHLFPNLLVYIDSINVKISEEYNLTLE